MAEPIDLAVEAARRSGKKNLATLTSVLPALGEFGFNEMLLTPSLNGVPLGDRDFIGLRMEVGRIVGWEPSQDMMRDAVQYVALGNRYHPVRQYLDGLAWDGSPRLKHYAEDVLMISDPTVLVVSMVVCFFVGAVARVYQPGCQLDTAFILQGPQGRRKSSHFRALCKEPAWFTDAAIDIHDKDSLLLMQRVWFWEWGELSTMRRANVQAVKDFLSKRENTFRPPYGRGIESFPRHTVICGSTNDETFLVDPSGDRRFHVVGVNEVDDDRAATWRDQYWAEAVDLYRNGEHWWLDEREEATRSATHAQWREEDAWAEKVLEYATGRSSGRVTVTEVLENAVQKPAGQWTTADARRVGDILRVAGWTQTRTQESGQRVRYWVAPKRGA